MGKRRQLSAEFKARVAMEALRGVKTLAEIVQEYQVHPVQVSTWKQELVERGAELFGKKPEVDPKDVERQRARLERKIGELTMDVEFLKKKCVELGIPLDGQP